MLSQHSKKHHAGPPSLVPDPLVDPGNPSHRDQARSTAYLHRSCSRMVALATSSSGPRSPRSPQTKTATVMLGSRPKQGSFASMAWSTCKEPSPMDSNLFWFDEEQWAKIMPHLPTNQPGPERKDDRRILSGIMHVLKIGCRWQDCPKEYGPHKTIYNRFARWSERGIWQKIFECVAAPCDPPEQAALDSSHVKAHRCAHGGKGGPIFRRSVLRKAVATARSTRLSTNSVDPGPSSSRPETLPIA
jgi:transposase